MDIVGSIRMDIVGSGWMNSFSDSSLAMPTLFVAMPPLADVLKTCCRRSLIDEE